MLQRLRLPAALDGNIWRYANLANANRQHHHAELELNLVTQGTGRYLIGGRRYEIVRGDLLWLFPAQEHVLFEQTQDFKMWIAIFRRRAIRRAAIDPASRPLLQSSHDGEACRRLSERDLLRFEGLFSELSSAADEPGLMNAGLAYTLLQAWRCFLRANNIPVHEVHPAVEYAAKLIRDDATGLQLNQLARRTGLSASRLSRLFKQQIGLSMVEFRNRQRIRRFQELYDTGQSYTMLDAALEAGFGSYPQFHRVFRQIVGCSPNDYKRRS